MANDLTRTPRAPEKWEGITARVPLDPKTRRAGGATGRHATGTIRDPELVRAMRKALRGCGFRDTKDFRLLEITAQRPGLITVRCRDGAGGVGIIITFGWNSEGKGRLFET